MVREGGPPTTCSVGSSPRRGWSAFADHDNEGKAKVMNNFVRVITVSSLLFVAACNPFPSTTTTPGGGGEAVDLSEVRTAVEGYAAKVNARDAAGASAIYANDPAFHWVESGRIGYATR